MSYLSIKAPSSKSLRMSSAMDEINVLGLVLESIAFSCELCISAHVPIKDLIFFE